MMAQRNVLLSTRRELVLGLLQDGAWHSTAQIIHPTVGGSEGMRRLRELRALGYPIEKRPHAGHDDNEYRLMSITESLRRRFASPPQDVKSDWKF